MSLSILDLGIVYEFLTKSFSGIRYSDIELSMLSFNHNISHIQKEFTVFDYIILYSHTYYGQNFAGSRSTLISATEPCTVGAIIRILFCRRCNVLLAHRNC